MSRHDLAAELRQMLRAAERLPGRAGRLKRSALARRIGVSASSLYAYLDGTTLPPAAVLTRLLDQLDVADAERQRLARIREALEPRRRSRSAPQRTGPIVPRQLPADVPGFTGRVVYLDQLNALLLRRDDGMGSVVIAGTAGVGKTVLAVHWAHQVADRFPDGQLFVNLRGFDPTRPPMEPAEAIRDFLDAFRVPPQHIPATLEAQAGLYRTLLADRRVLVLLDNARDAAQVRPLLPGAAGCHVVVTSRDQLTSLVSVEAASPLLLDLLTRAEARQLLERRLGSDRLAAELDATDEIITRCARLPLALTIVAARAATRPTIRLDELAQELRQMRISLDAFSDPDPTADVRAALNVSYRTLTRDAAHLFRLLGLHPGPDISIPAAASLLGTHPTKLRQMLVELTRAHLLNEAAPDRYSFHDLMRACATELTHAQDNDDYRQAATRRMLDFYLHTARAAVNLVNPHRMSVEVGPVYPDVVPEDLDDQDSAIGWFARERPVLLAVIAQAATAGFDAHVWQLAWIVGDHLQCWGHWHDWEHSQHAALDAGRRLDDPLAQAFAHRSLGQLASAAASYDDGLSHLLDALDQFRRLGNRIGQAHTHISLSTLFDRQRRPREAGVHAQQALELFRAEDDVAGQANALNAVGWMHAQLGDYQQALDHCRQALALQHQVGDQLGPANTWDSLGYAHHHLGHHQQAVTCYEHALKLAREHGNRLLEGEVLDHLGDANRDADDNDAARKAWQRALTIFLELDHANAGQVLVKLGQSPSNDR